MEPLFSELGRTPVVPVLVLRWYKELGLRAYLGHYFLDHGVTRGASLVSQGASSMLEAHHAAAVSLAGLLQSPSWSQDSIWSWVGELALASASQVIA